jgi:superfamily I DNA and/or RNA helicase
VPYRPTAHTLDAPDSSELGILLREINKKKRHMPLRQLFARVPTMLTRLKPCLMMSPLAVSTYLNSDDFRFDLVIFDEASQVRPYDAISAIYRGDQIVVAGDQKQLPPSNFFERSVGDEDLSSEEQETEELGLWGSGGDLDR